MSFENFKKESKDKRFLKDIEFEIKNIDVSILNSIRRTILSKIPCLGFYFNADDHFVNHDITIYKNESPLHNEIIAHRISMIPIYATYNDILNWDIIKS